MSDLTRTDRVFRALARYLDKPALRLVASQRVLRALFSVTARLGSALPAGTHVAKHPDGSLTIRPPGVATDAPVIYYLHGGGFTIGGPRTHAGLLGHLARDAGMRGQVQHYRLAPEHPFPAARDDAIQGYRALIEAGTPPVAICGDSAGGCLALQVACHARDAGWPMPRALGLIAPIADLSGDIEARFAEAPGEMLIPAVWARRIRAAYLPDMDPRDPAISPLLGDLSGLPPTLIQAGGEEALLADAERLEAAMDDATLERWPGLPHVWHLHAGRAPAADRALRRMAAFLRDQVPR